MRIKKIIIIMGMMMTMCFALFACKPIDELQQAKTEGGNLIDAYMASKGQDNYSAENWALIEKAQAEGKAAVHAAEDNFGVELAVKNARWAMDDVVPMRSDELKEGVYLITDDSWERYVRGFAEQFEEDEAWIQNAIVEGHGNMNNNYHPEIEVKNWFGKIISNGQMTEFDISGNICTITNKNGIYLYKEKFRNNFSDNFWLIGDILFVKNFGIVRQFQYNPEYRFSEDQPKKLEAPVELELFETVMEWKYPGRSLPWGCYGGKIEVRYPNSEEFTYVSTSQWIGGIFCVFDSLYSDLNLKPGKNTIRICHLGGPAVSQKEKLIKFTADSEYYIFDLFVDENGKVIIKN